MHSAYAETDKGYDVLHKCVLLTSESVLIFALQSLAVVIMCCLLSVTRVQCDKAAEVRIMRFSR